MTLDPTGVHAPMAVGLPHGVTEADIAGPKSRTYRCDQCGHAIREGDDAYRDELNGLWFCDVGCALGHHEIRWTQYWEEG